MESITFAAIGTQWRRNASDVLLASLYERGTSISLTSVQPHNEKATRRPIVKKFFYKSLLERKEILVMMSSFYLVCDQFNRSVRLSSPLLVCTEKVFASWCIWHHRALKLLCKCAHPVQVHAWTHMMPGSSLQRLCLLSALHRSGGGGAEGRPKVVPPDSILAGKDLMTRSISQTMSLGSKQVLPPPSLMGKIIVDRFAWETSNRSGVVRRISTCIISLIRR